MKRLSLLFAALLPAHGCVDVPDEGRQAVVATHVRDWRDEVVYQLLVDRFADGNVNNNHRVQPGYLARYQGGDWQGVVDHLDYLVELGVTTLWISPVIRNVETDADVDAYHGYWAQDLTEVNPHFGSLADLRSLTAHAHERGLKVVLDVVTNHMGQVFFYDMNLNGRPDVNLGGTGVTSPVRRTTEFDPDWDPRGVQAETSLGIAGRAPILFLDDPSISRVPPKPAIFARREAYHGFGRILNYDDEAQRLLGDFPGGLKDVATENPDVRKAMIDVYTRWAVLADLDGFRIDTVKHVEHAFWQVFAQGVRETLARAGKEKFLLFGEAFDGNDALLGSYTREGELDSVFYFSQHFQVFRDVFQHAARGEGARGTRQIEALWAERPMHYSTTPQDKGIGVAPAKFPVNFLDNHDVARFLFDAAGRTDVLRNALTLLFTEEGLPCLYYGTEQDFAGGNDPANREVLWNTGFATTGDTFRHVAKLTRLRRTIPALRYGDTTVVWSTDHTGGESDAGLFAFERKGGDAGDSYALVVLNTSVEKASVTEEGGRVMKVSAPPGARLVDVLDPARTTYTVAQDGGLRLEVPATRGLVLVLEGE